MTAAGASWSNGCNRHFEIAEDRSTQDGLWLGSLEGPCSFNDFIAHSDIHAQKRALKLKPRNPVCQNAAPSVHSPIASSNTPTVKELTT